MNLVHKLCFLTLISVNIYIHANNEEQRNNERAARELQLAQEQAAFWNGLSVGAIIAAGGAVTAYLLSSSQPTANLDSQSVNSCNELYITSSKIEIIKAQLSRLSKYGQLFNFAQRKNEIESALESNIQKLGLQVYQVDSNFFNILDEDHKIIDNAGYTLWWESGYNDLKYQKDCYLASVKQLKSYFRSHESFIHGYQLINLYDRLPSSSAHLPAFIRSFYQGSELYPLCAFKNKIQQDKDFLERLEWQSSSVYPSMIRKAQSTARILGHLISLLCSHPEFQQELDKIKRDQDHEALLAVQRKIAQAEQDKANFARREAQAREEANRLKLREIQAIEERNEIEREKNRIAAASAGIYYRN